MTSLPLLYRLEITPEREANLYRQRLNLPPLRAFLPLLPLGGVVFLLVQGMSVPLFFYLVIATVLAFSFFRGSAYELFPWPGKRVVDRWVFEEVDAFYHYRPQALSTLVKESKFVKSSTWETEEWDDEREDNDFLLSLLSPLTHYVVVNKTRWLTAADPKTVLRVYSFFRKQQARRKGAQKVTLQGKQEQARFTLAQEELSLKKAWQEKS